jgi:hypothetical protein
MLSDFSYSSFLFPPLKCSVVLCFRLIKLVLKNQSFCGVAESRRPMLLLEHVLTDSAAQHFLVTSSCLCSSISIVLSTKSFFQSDEGLGSDFQGFMLGLHEGVPYVH